MAQSIKALRRRLRTVKSTQKITKAMETVSSVKLRRAQDRLHGARPYAGKLAEIVRALADDEAAREHPLTQVRPVRRRTLVVATSDRGMCGAFNANVIRLATNFIAEHGDANLEVVTAGRRGRDHFARQRRAIADQLVPLGGQAEPAEAAALAQRLMERFLSGETDEVWVIATHMVSLIQYTPKATRLLPLDLGQAAGGEGHRAARLNYIHEPSAAEVLGAVLPRTVESNLYLALAESIASEHGARRIAMHNATENCSELGTQLTLDINKARQASITKELLEIVGGAEALKG